MNWLKSDKGYEKISSNNQMILLKIKKKRSENLKLRSLNMKMI